MAYILLNKTRKESCLVFNSHEVQYNSLEHDDEPYDCNTTMLDLSTYLKMITVLNWSNDDTIKIYISDDSQIQYHYIEGYKQLNYYIVNREAHFG